LSKNNFANGFPVEHAPPANTDIFTIAARQYVTNTVHISGGHYATPYIVSTPNTEYILDGDISADGTAITIKASYVVINLNGHTITYNNVSAGNGIESGDYNFHDIAVTYGQIIQGAAMSTGATYGIGNNPVQFKTYIVQNAQVAGIYAKYGGQDVAGFQLGGDNHVVEYNTLEDVFGYGIVTDRHSGISSIHMWGGYANIRNNTIVNARQRGIEVGSNSNVYNNTIGIRSICTNSAGVEALEGYIKIYGNTITGRGEHPIGIIAGNSIVGAAHDIEVYNNIIDTQVTGAGLEYNGPSYPGPTTWIQADKAVGVRSTPGVINLSVHDNTITVHGDFNFQGVWSVDGSPVTMGAGARGLMLGLRYNGQSMKVYNNTVTALDKDGTGYVAGIAIDANIDNNTWYNYQPPAADFSPDLVVTGNTVTSNIYNVALGDDYGPSSGHPLILQNTFIKSGSYSTYATYGSGISGYYEGTARIIANSYQGGAAENSLDMHFENVSNNVPGSGGSYRNKSLIFGRFMLGTVKDASNSLVANTRIRTFNASGAAQTDATTDTNGSAQFMVYDYELGNAGGTTGKTTPTTVAYRPHTIDLYDLTTGRNIFTTAADASPVAWDSMTSRGTFILSGTGGSLTISN